MLAPPVLLHHPLGGVDGEALRAVGEGALRERGEGREWRGELKRRIAEAYRWPSSTSNVDVDVRERLSGFEQH
jgi:hypothetical protein